jgi:heme oxygenase
MPRSAETLSPDPLAALRAATASRHELLDSNLPIGAPDATLDDYIGHLRMVRAWLAPLHAWLADFDDGPDCACAGRLALIDADLRDAGAPRAESMTSPAAPAWPATASAAWRWGVCYVVEGSQLGGAVLYARLRERLAPALPEGGRGRTRRRLARIHAVAARARAIRRRHRRGVRRRVRGLRCDAGVAPGFALSPTRAIPFSGSVGQNP